MEETPLLISCPKCKSVGIERMPRPQIVKFLTSKKKFYCPECRTSFYIDRERIRVNLSLMP